MATATGPIAIPIQVLKQVIVGSSAFVAQCAIDGLTPDDQVMWIAYRPEFQGDVVAPDELARPFVLLRPKDFAFREFDTQCMQPQMGIDIHIQDAYRDSTYQDSAIEFLSFVGNLMQDIADSNMTSTSLVIREITQQREAMAVPRRDEMDRMQFWTIEFSMRIGADL